MISTKKNPRGRLPAGARRRAFPPPEVREAGRSPDRPGRPAYLVDAILAEFHRRGVAAGRAPALASPITAGRRTGSEAVVVVIDHSMVASLFGECGGGRVSFRPLLRAIRARSGANRLCETSTATATAIDARRILIVCDAGRTSPAERTRAIRWVREVAYRIGYACSINGLHDLGTSYLILAADTEAVHAARSVVDWYRGGVPGSSGRRRNRAALSGARIRGRPRPPRAISPRE